MQWRRQRILFWGRRRVALGTDRALHENAVHPATVLPSQRRHAADLPEALRTVKPNAEASTTVRVIAFDRNHGHNSSKASSFTCSNELRQQRSANTPALTASRNVDAVFDAKPVAFSISKWRHACEPRNNRLVCHFCRRSCACRPPCSIFWHLEFCISDEERKSLFYQLLVPSDECVTGQRLVRPGGSAMLNSFRHDSVTLQEIRRDCAAYTLHLGS